MKKIVLLFLLCFGMLIVRSEGIKFFHGDFNAASEKANELPLTANDSELQGYIQGKINSLK